MGNNRSVFGGGMEIGDIIQKFGYQKKKYQIRIIGGGAFLIICLLICARISSNISAYNRTAGIGYKIAAGSANGAYMFLVLMGVLEFIESFFWAYAYYQMYIEVGSFGIRGKAWNKEVKFIPTMPQFFQLSYSDIVKVEYNKMLKVYTKQGREYYLYVENASRAKTLMEQHAASLLEQDDF